MTAFFGSSDQLRGAQATGLSRPATGRTERRARTSSRNSPRCLSAPPFRAASRRSARASRPCSPFAGKRCGLRRILRAAWLIVLLLAALIQPATAADKLAELTRAFSGHIAVLPAPGMADLSSLPGFRALREAGLDAHLFMLTPAQLADTNSFQARRFPVALHCGYEAYLQTIRRTGDGDAALRNYLAGGGTLLVLSAGPFPMYYNEAYKPANGAAVVGLNIGAGAFERPPAGLNLAFCVNTNQAILPHFHGTIPFPRPEEADQRWRPSRPPAGADVRYTPMVTLMDERGGNHGEAAALLEFTQGPLRGGRVLYVGFSLLNRERDRLAVLSDALRWALTGRPALPSSLLRDHFDGRQSVLGDDALWSLDAGAWKIDQGELVGENCVADQFEIKGAARGNLGWRDYAFTVRFKIESRAGDWRDGAWFGIRCRPDGDGYYLTFTDRDCQLHKTIYGHSTGDGNPLARVPWKADAAWHTLRVEARANRMRASLDGGPLFDVKDDSHLYLPSLRSGGVVLAARKSSAAKGKTVVRFDDVDIQLLEH